jgi:hypothetical protein
MVPISFKIHHVKSELTGWLKQKEETKQQSDAPGSDQVNAVSYTTKLILCMISIYANIIVLKQHNFHKCTGI